MMTSLRSTIEFDTKLSHPRARIRDCNNGGDHLPPQQTSTVDHHRDGDGAEVRMRELTREAVMIERFFPEPGESDSIGRRDREREREKERKGESGREGGSIKGGRGCARREVREGQGGSRAHLLAGWAGDGRMGGL